jgi:hypothetical protein
VTQRSPFRLAAGAGLWLAAAAAAEPPIHADAVPSANAAVINPADQHMADAVARRLAESGKARGANLDIACQNGVVALAGTVDPALKNEVIQLAKAVPHVRQVIDQMNQSTGIVPVAALEASLPPPIPLGAPTPMPGGMPPGGMMPGGGVAVDPVPLNVPHGNAPYDLNPPRMPPYAWPTYAPYNNFSRVGYPEEYPHSAFPFIGPFYPFPKVPPGWRAIKLEWEDGSWFYGRTATHRDWWRIRYW